MLRIREAWLAALAAAAVGAMAEVRWAQASATLPLNVARAWLSAFGLLVPAALVLALLVAAAWRLLGGPRAEQRPRRLERTRVPLVLGLGAALALGLVAQLALRLLASDWPLPLLVAGLALGSLLVLRCLLGASLTLASSPALLRLDARLPQALSLGLGVCGACGPIAYGIARGTPNGDGGFWQIFGVLSRQELDLRAPALLLGLAAAAALGAYRGRSTPEPLVVASAFAAFSWLATATRLLDDEALLLAIQRGGGLARNSLRLQRSLADRDRDGVARAFGDHDCDDADQRVHPGALDLPDNGLDEDCSGADDASVMLALAPAASAPALSRADLAPAAPAAFHRTPLLADAGSPDAAAPGVPGLEPTPPLPPAPVPPPPSEPAPPAPQPLLPSNLNVLLITVDTLRYDLGFAGYARPTSPNLDRLAQRSLVFDNAYSFASYTGKSIGPLLIGKYPSETDRGFFHFNRFGKSETFVQERLQAAGVRTLSVQAHWYFTPQYGLGRGFDVLDLSAEPPEQKLEGDTSVTGDRLTDAAIARLSQPENVAGRFFMWVHYLDPHADYVRHEGFDFGNRARDLYDSEVAFTDQQIGRLLDALQRSEIGARTAVVVTSDHGETFGEHGQWRHGYELWEALVHVPLIIFAPGLPGRHVATRRGAIDLAPTLLALFGVPAPAGEQGLVGRSLLPDAFVPPGSEPAPRPLFIDMSEGPYNEERQALIDGDLKLIMSNGRVIGLYDLGQDPTEALDRRDDRVLLGDMRGRFVAFARQLRRVVVKPP